jgi:hypothetical protein
MGEAVATVGKKGLALLVLMGAAYLLFKVVLGFVATIAWIAIAVIAVIAVVWAIRIL